MANKVWRVFTGATLIVALLLVASCDLQALEIGPMQTKIETVSLGAADTVTAEIVLGGSLLLDDDQAASVDAPKTESDLNSAQLSLTFKREIDIERYPILASHVLDRKPVVPFALITEWLGYGALHGNPGLMLQGLEDVRILNGIKLEKKSHLIRLLAGKARKNGSFVPEDLYLNWQIFQYFFINDADAGAQGTGSVIDLCLWQIERILAFNIT